MTNGLEKAKKLTDGLTKKQHLVALLIMLPSMPFAIPLSLLVTLTRGLNIGSEWLYDLVGHPFLAVRRAWIIRCERVNAQSLDTGGGEA